MTLVSIFHFVIHRVCLLNYVWITVISFAFAGCSGSPGKPVTAQQENLLSLVRSKASLLQATFIRVNETDDFEGLPLADTVFRRELKKFGVMEPDPESGAVNPLFYYGYLQLPYRLTGCLFAYSVFSCCGDDRLVMAVIDEAGKMRAAITAAQIATASECTIRATTRLADSLLTTANWMECAVLEGADIDRVSIDSSTIVYKITPEGGLAVVQRDTVSIVR